MHRIIKHVIINGKIFCVHPTLEATRKNGKTCVQKCLCASIRKSANYRSFSTSLSKYAFQQRLLGLLKVLFVSADVVFLCRAVFPKWVIQNRRGEEHGVFFSPAHSVLSLSLSLSLSLFWYTELIRHPSSTTPQSLLCTASLISIQLSHE